MILKTFDVITVNETIKKKENPVKFQEFPI